MVMEIKVKLQHSCPFIDFSLQFGKKTMQQYCSTTTTYLIIPGEATEHVKDVAGSLFTDVNSWKFVNIGNPASSTLIIIERCFCGNEDQGFSVSKRFRDLKGITISPVYYIDGWEYHKVFSPTNKELVQIINMLQNLPVYKIISIKDLGEDWLINQSSSITQILEQLTDHQIRTFLLAFERGYYDIPRTIRTSDLADELGVSRYAVERTIRASENKIVQNLIPFFYLKQKLKEADNLVLEEKYQFLE